MRDKKTPEPPQVGRREVRIAKAKVAIVTAGNLVEKTTGRNRKILLGTPDLLNYSGHPVAG